MTIYSRIRIEKQLLEKKNTKKKINPNLNIQISTIFDHWFISPMHHTGFRDFLLVAQHAADTGLHANTVYNMQSINEEERCLIYEGDLWSCKDL